VSDGVIVSIFIAEKLYSLLSNLQSVSLGLIDKRLLNFFAGYPMTLWMPAKETKKKGPGRRSTGKITVALRFYQETKDLLEKAIVQTRSASLSEYVERAVLDRFKKDGIK
jgi:hypothetical protein